MEQEVTNMGLMLKDKILKTISDETYILSSDNLGNEDSLAFVIFLY